MIAYARRQHVSSLQNILPASEIRIEGAFLARRNDSTRQWHIGTARPCKV